MELRYAENAKYLIMALAGLIMSCLGYLTYIFTPIDLIVDSMTTLKPGSLLHNLWTEPPLEVLLEVYIFNVTNPEEFLAGTEKIRVQEIGPYTYQETLKNTEGIFNSNDTLTYKPIRGYIFKRELSVGDPETDYLVVPNVPLLGMGSYLSSYNFFVRMGFNAMTADAKQFLNLTVKDYLWGYEDKLVSLASTYIPQWIDFPTFGILDRMASLDTGNTVTINLKETKDQFGNLIKPYSISKFNGSPGLRQWNYKEVEGNETCESNSQCNTVEGSFEPGLLPKNLPENTTLSVYRRAFCRPVLFRYENTSTSPDGYEIYNYRVDQNFMDSGDVNPDYKCYCLDGKCLPSGFNSLSPCYYGIPIVISQPHYYNADEEIKKQVDGLYPDREKHDTTATMNPSLGLPIEGHIRVQVNLHISENGLTKVKQFSDKYVPLLWLELRAMPPSPYVKFLLNMVLYVAPIAQAIIMWLLGILGLSMIAASALIIVYFPPERRLEDPYGHRIGYSPILVLPLSSRLKDTRIS